MRGHTLAAISQCDGLIRLWGSSQLVMINKSSVNKIVGSTTINHEHGGVVMYGAREFDEGFGFVTSELVDLLARS